MYFASSVDVRVVLGWSILAPSSLDLLTSPGGWTGYWSSSLVWLGRCPAYWWWSGSPQVVGEGNHWSVDLWQALGCVDMFHVLLGCDGGLPMVITRKGETPGRRNYLTFLVKWLISFLGRSSWAQGSWPSQVCWWTCEIRLGTRWIHRQVFERCQRGGWQASWWELEAQGRGVRSPGTGG